MISNVSEKLAADCDSSIPLCELKSVAQVVQQTLLQALLISADEQRTLKPFVHSFLINAICLCLELHHLKNFLDRVLYAKGAQVVSELATFELRER
jgi:hypothetical protein